MGCVKIMINKRDILILITISIIFKLAISFITINIFHSFVDQFDLTIYATYAGNISTGSTPYIEFNLEYPPLFLIPVYIGMFVANFFKNIDAFYTSFQISMAIFDTITILCVYLISLKFYNRDKSFLCALIYSLSLSCAYFTITKYDALPVMIFMISIVLFLYKQNLSCYSTSIIGFFTKWFPIIPLPYFIISNFKHSVDKKESYKNILIPIICAGIIFIFLLSLNKDGFLYPFIIQSTRNPNVVSFPYFIDHITKTTIFSRISFYITIIIETILLISFYFIKKPSYRQTLIYILISTMIFVLFNNVFSPQYIMWFSPLLIIFLSQSSLELIYYTTLQIIIYLEFPISFGTLYTNNNISGILAYILFISKFAIISFIIYILLKRGNFFEHITHTTQGLASSSLQK